MASDNSNDLMASYVKSMVCQVDDAVKHNSFANCFTGNEVKEMESIASGASQKFFIMRHAERIDFTFGCWVPYCFDDSGNYNRKDLNMPTALPKRKLGAAGYSYDTPLTQIGICQSKLVGEGMKAANINIEHVYCSPALRSVQTCDGVLRGLGKKDEIKIKVEPALFDWLEWSKQSLPDLMTEEELIAAGYNIDTAYRPCMSKEDFNGTTDTFERFFARQSKIVKHALARCPTGNILFVGHALTFKACICELLGDFEPGLGELIKGAELVPYAGLQTLTRNGDKWDIIKSPLFSLTHAKNIRFNNRVLF